MAAALPCSAGAREGHAAQLDFLVVSFLAGNDYLPKVRGANLPKLWARCAKLDIDRGCAMAMASQHDRIHVGESIIESP